MEDNEEKEEKLIVIIRRGGLLEDPVGNLVVLYTQVSLSENLGVIGSTSVYVERHLHIEMAGPTGKKTPR